MHQNIDDPRTEDEVARDISEAMGARNAALDAKVREAFGVLEELPRGRMSEHVFHAKYLKFFSPIPVPKEELDLALKIMSEKIRRPATVESLRANLINEWLKDAVSEDGMSFNTPSYPVDIYNDEGEIIFTVPPLMVSKKLDSKISSSIVQLSLMSSAIFENDRMQGDSIVSQKIRPLIPKPQLDQKTVDAWNIVYKHYGLPIFVDGEWVGVPDNNSGKGQTGTDYDDVFSFD